MEVLGFIGAIIVALAYLPQIIHLITKKCAYGISIKAWSLWLFAALLMLPYAISKQDTVFILLQTITVISTAFITIFSYFHQGKTCDRHTH